jgi:sister-chromatid-cohesion protein PDS5
VRHLQETNAGLDSVLPRLISLLAHHPDFDNDVDSLVSQGRYILYYISNVATESNLGLIQKYAERTKQVLDGIEEEKSENIYVLCDLALAVIKAWQEKRGWTSEPYPGKVGLPKGLFKGLPSHDAAQRIADKQWIPDGVDERLEELIRSVDRKKVWPNPVVPHLLTALPIKGRLRC